MTVEMEKCILAIEVATKLSTMKSQWIEGILMLLTAFSSYPLMMRKRRKTVVMAVMLKTQKTLFFNITFLFLIKRKINSSVHLI